MKTAIVAGATGLIGKSLVQKLLEDLSYEKVISLVRKATGNMNPRLFEIVVNFDQLSEYQTQLKGDDVFCCLGTTMSKARSKEAFWKVDHDYPFNLAKITHAMGATRFYLVSALGADAGSSIYYNQVKGKVEEAINTVPFEAIHIFRPSLLLGPREESRPGEDAAKIFYRIFNFLIPVKYKGIEGDTVADAMLHYSKSNDRGKFIHTSGEMQQLAK